MGKILSYSNLNGAPAGGDVMFIGDVSVSASNPEIKYVCTDDLFKRSSIAAATAAGLNITDDGGTSSIFIADGGSVGIGTTGPSYPVHVCRTTGNLYSYNQSTATNSNVGIVTKNDAQGWTFGTTATDTFSISKGVADFTTAKYFEINTSGSVGIGTSTFSGHVNVSGSVVVDSTNDLYLDAANNEIRLSGGTLKINEYGGGTSGAAQTNDVQIYGQGGSSPLFFADASTSRIGINTNAPSNTLHVSSSDSAVLKAATTSSSGYIQVSNSTNSAYFGRSSSGIFIGACSSFNAGNVNIGANGETHIGGTSLAYKLQVSSCDYLLGRFNSTNTSGSAFSMLSDQQNPPNVALTFSRTVSSTARVNWLTGTFYSSGSYFGIHNKDVTLSASNATFDTTTLTNNLFYINTSGDQYLAKSINTHNCTNTGHNTGRFVQSFAARFYLDGNNPTLVGAFGNGFDADYLRSDTATSACATQFYVPAPYAGKLIKTVFYGGATDGTTYDRCLYACFSRTASGSTPPTSLANCNSAYLTATINETTFDGETTVVKNASDYTDDNSNLNFDAGDMLAFSVMGCRTGGTKDGYFTTVLSFEFKID